MMRFANVHNERREAIRFRIIASAVAAGLLCTLAVIGQQQAHYVSAAGFSSMATLRVKPAAGIRRATQPEYPKPGKIIFGVPREAHGRYVPFNPKDCDTKIASIREDKPVAWVARFETAHNSSSKIQFFRLNGGTHVAQLVYAGRAMTAGRLRVHGFLSAMQRQRRHLTFSGNGSNLFRVTYSLSGKILASGEFRLTPYTVVTGY